MQTLRGILTLWVLTLIPISLLHAQSGGKGLVINEIYIGSMAVSGSTATDQFIEIYNPQSTTQYLDGCMIVRFGETGGKLTGSALQQPVEAWKFPGTSGGTTLSVQPGAFVVIAASAKNFSGGLDLSSAGFETYTGSSQNDDDNSNSINLHHIGGNANTDFQLSASREAVVLTNGLDSVLTDGINLSTVIDGVQYNTAWTAGSLPASIDAGFTGGPNLKLGVSMERKQAGVTTLNSNVDFALYHPSPGSQHGTKTTKTVTGASLMPLDLGRFVDYNSYVTDTNGRAIPSTLSHSSYTVTATGVTFQGQSSVAVVRDTSNAKPDTAGKALDLHYLALESGDVQVYADGSFMQLFVPPGIASLAPTPNRFVDYIKLSGEINTPYPIATITFDTTVSLVKATVTITSTGNCLGIEKMTLPGGTYDSAYRFDFVTEGKVTNPLLGTLSDITVTLHTWLVQGIGIVRTNMASVNNTVVPLPGNERDMTTYGKKTLGVLPVQLHAGPNIQLYPNPAADQMNASFDRPAKRVLLYASTGQMLRSFELPGSSLEAMLWIGDIPNGVYYARVEFTDGSQSAVHVVVQH